MSTDRLTTEVRRSSRFRESAHGCAPSTASELCESNVNRKRPASFAKNKATPPKKKVKKSTSNRTIATRKNPKRKSAPKLLEDSEGNQVWLAPINLQDIRKAEKTRRHPFGQKKRLYLHTVTSPAQREVVYERACRALQDIETCLLPRYGGRQWKVLVTIKDPTVEIGNSKTKRAHSVSPYFVFHNGMLELAAWPHILLKIPSPPRFPGYYASSKTKETAKAKKNNGKRKKKSSPIDAIEGTDCNIGDDDNVDDDESDQQESQVVDEEMEIIYDLQERDVTPLSELAFAERWRVPLPSISTKWISPLREIFTSRKSAWDHAVSLCKQDVVLEKVIRGYDMIRNRPMPSSTTITAKRALQVGEMRFRRDGLWVVGQEDSWKVEEEERHNYNNINIKPAVRPRLSGQQFYVQCHRRELRAKRQNEALGKCYSISIVDRPTSISIEQASGQSEKQIATSNSTGNGQTSTTLSSSQGSAAVEKSVKVKKFTLKEADEVLRQKWKTLTEEEKKYWKQKAADKHAEGTLASTKGQSSVTAGTTVDKAKWLKGIPNEKSSSLNPVVGRVSGRVTPSTREESKDAGPPQPTTSSTGCTFRVAAQKTIAAESLEATSLRHTSRQPTWKKWCLNAHQVKLCYDAALKHYDTVIATVKARGLHQELQDGFDVLRERCRGRFDMELPAFEGPEFGFLTDLKRAPWIPLAQSILGKNVVLIHKGVFLAMPGAETQPYHQDGVHLTTHTQRDCHAINVFVPLVDLTKKHGPTEFCLGTHILGQEDFDPEFVEAPVVAAGTPIIFDYRLGHKGLSNNSGTCRPILYCTYSGENNGKEFRDSVNFSRKRYHRIGNLVNNSNIPSRQARAEKRQQTMESTASEMEEQDLKQAIENSCQEIHEM